MSIVAPQERQYLSADALFRLVRSGFAAIPDPLNGDPEMAFTNALMSALAMFSLQSPSLLAFDKQRAEGNLGTISGVEHVPCDPPMRERRAPVSPASLRPLFQSVFRHLHRGKVLAAMVFLDGYYFVALDGTGYFSSPTMHCASCLHKVHRHGSLTSYHQRLGAALIHPDGREGIPLMPAPMIQPDGPAKNACERHAAQRFLAKVRQAPPHRKGIITDDSLRAKAPHLETLHDHGLPYLLGGKEGEHPSLFTQVQAAEPAGRVTADERHDRAAGGGPRLRLVNDVPLHASRADVQVKVIAYGERGKDKGQAFRWVPAWRVRQRNVSQLMRGGRARGKMEKETFHTLQNQGYTFEHNYGQGTQHLSGVFATMRRRALLVDHPQQRCWA